MKVLVVIPTYPNYSGVDYHRLLMPHMRMADLYPENVVAQINEVDSAEIEFLKTFDIVVLNRFVSRTGAIEATIRKLSEAGVKIVVDLDDDYIIPEWHILHAASKQDKHAQKIIQGLKAAALVTTTHEGLAKTIQTDTGQTKIACIPNGINPEADQFKLKPPTWREVRFGWSGSVTHCEDVLLMYEGLLSMYKNESIRDKFCVVYGGFNPQDQYCVAINSMMSARGVAKEKNYVTWPVAKSNEYAMFYDRINVALIPLRDNRFNNNKSNLKLLEAGFKKKAVIISDVQPYSPMLKHGVNCLVVKHKNDWYRNMMYLINNPELITSLGEQLYQDVQTHHIDNIATLRYQTYKKLL